MAADLEKSNPHTEGLNGAVVAELRAEKAAQGLTNKDLADRSGIPVVSIQRYLGRVPTRGIDMENLQALAGALGATAGAIIRRAEIRLARTDVQALDEGDRRMVDAEVDAAVRRLDDHLRDTRPGSKARRDAMQEMDDVAARDEDRQA